jgi:tetratricopeptide (TPR) repeat protein
MKRAGLLITTLSGIFFVTSSLFAASEPWGSLKKARSKYPELFVPGIVQKMTIGKAECYVVCGSAERFFKDQRDESDQELFSEAELSAKHTLLKFFSNAQENSSTTLSISELTNLYWWREHDIYYALFAVPVKNVFILKDNFPPNATSIQPKIVPPPIDTDTTTLTGTQITPENYTEPSTAENNKAPTQCNKEGKTISTWFKLAEVDYREGNYDDAYLHYAKLINCYDEHSVMPEDRILWRAAKSAELTGHFGMALTYYKKLTGRDYLFSKYSDKAQQKVYELSINNAE